MKYTLLLLIAVFSTACGTSQKIKNVSAATKAFEKQIELNIPKANAINIATDLTFLSSDELKGRETGTPEILLASSYLQDRLNEMNVRPYEGLYLDFFEADQKNAFNVVGVIPGSDGNLTKEVVVIGAHYDHIGMLEAVNGDAIANGANDNATGVSTVLEIVRILQEFEFNRRTVVIAFFSGEEKGLLGSKHLATRMKEEGKNVVAMVNFEMVGVPMKDKDYFTYLTGYETSNMGEIFNEENLSRMVTGLLPKAQEFNLYARSDNYPFANTFNIPAQTISTFDFTNFDFYHQVDDEASLMDTNHMAEVVDAVLPGLLQIFNGTRLKAN